MNEQPNTPMMRSGGSTSIIQTWINALTKPNEQTFADMAASPNAKASTAFLWVFVGALVNFFFASLVQGPLMRQYLQQSGFGDQFGNGLGGGLVTAICGAPIAAAIGVLFFAIFAGVVQWLARMFGGRGTFDQLAYALAAITVPFTLLNSIFTLLAAIPLVGLCFGIVSLLAGLYVLVLEVMAVKGVNQFGWGQAIGSLFLPGLVLACCLFVAVFSLMSVLAPRIGEIFSTINQTLP